MLEPSGEADQQETDGRLADRGVSECAGKFACRVEQGGGVAVLSD
jgi:hypothetical protein